MPCAAENHTIFREASASPTRSKRRCGTPCGNKRGRWWARTHRSAASPPHRAGSGLSGRDRRSGGGRSPGRPRTTRSQSPTHRARQKWEESVSEWGRDFARDPSNRRNACKVRVSNAAVVGARAAARREARRLSATPCCLYLCDAARGGAGVGSHSTQQTGLPACPLPRQASLHTPQQHVQLVEAARGAGQRGAMVSGASRAVTVQVQEARVERAPGERLHPGLDLRHGGVPRLRGDCASGDGRNERNDVSAAVRRPFLCALHMPSPAASDPCARRERGEDRNHNAAARALDPRVGVSELRSVRHVGHLPRLHQQFPHDADLPLGPGHLFEQDLFERLRLGDVFLSFRGRNEEAGRARWA